MYGEWPTQLLDAFVIALEKQPGAETVGQFRPISIFPLVLQDMEQRESKTAVAPSGTAGSHHMLWQFAQQTCSHLWRKVLVDIEASQLQGSSFSGGVIDLVKAFNMLPRILIFLARLGIPATVLRPWNTALSGVARRFKIRAATGPPLKSTTGLAEGCGLSVVATLALNVFCHHFCVRACADACLWSYVDNIEISSETPEGIVQGMEALRELWILPTSPTAGV